MRGRLVRSRLSEEGQPREPTNGVRACVRDYTYSIRCLTPFMDRLKVFFCDAHAASVLSCSLRPHDLIEHGVTLLEDLMTPQQPIMSSPARYFLSWRMRL
ncbi:hypothetical protein TcBrA4_0108580 [Trypanosoma cruzi]|nr:hypothetical protein TcBrA4_0108580 [Trypanosoma cruzi]